MAGWLSKPNEHEQVTALLSPYLDGHTSVADRALVEHHLASCAECARDLATLKATVAAVREMPRVRAPQSFALPRSMAKQPQSFPGLGLALRAASVLATVLFFITVGGDVFLANLPPRAAAPAPALVARELGAGPAPTASLFKSEPQDSPQALDAAVPAATRSALEKGRALPGTPVEPPAEQPLQPGGLGTGGNLPPAAAPAAPVRPPTSLTNEAEPQATAASKLAASAPGVTSPTTVAAQAAAIAPSSTVPPALTAKAGPSATPSATVVVQAAASVPPSMSAAVPTPVPLATALRSDAATAVAPQPANPLRVAEGALALLAMAFGVTARIFDRRRR